MKLEINCFHCKEPMKPEDTGYSYSHHTDDERGNTDAEYWTQYWKCSKDHAAVVWFVDYEPFNDEAWSIEFDGEINYLDLEKSETVHTEQRREKAES